MELEAQRIFGRAYERFSVISLPYAYGDCTTEILCSLKYLNGSPALSRFNKTFLNQIG